MTLNNNNIRETSVSTLDQYWHCHYGVSSMAEFDNSISIQTIGREQNRIAFVHDVFDDPDRVISRAESAEYVSKSKAYPGVRSPVDKDIAALVKSAIAAAASQLLAAEIRELAGGVHYSIVTQRPFDRRGIVQKPHFDDSKGFLMAAVLYLNRGPHGGTGFFRHRGTGFERITSDRKPFYDTVVKIEQARLARLEKTPPGSDHPCYDRIATADPVFNRMVVYPGGNLHSGDIHRFAPTPVDARSGRLTINAFLTPILPKEGRASNSV